MFEFNGIVRLPLPTPLTPTSSPLYQETKDKQIEVSDVNGLSVKHILDYIHTTAYVLLRSTPIPQGSYCSHSNFALFHGPTTSANIFKRACPCVGKALARQHVLQHVRIYAVADYVDMGKLKAYARRGVEDVLHVYWQFKSL